MADDEAHLAEQLGNIDLIYEAAGHSHFALEALRWLGTNGIFVLTGVPGLQAFTETDPARTMRNMVLNNQVPAATSTTMRPNITAILRLRLSWSPRAM